VANAKPLVFTLLDASGQEVRELLTAESGKQKVYRFPYTTADTSEIAYLDGIGAKSKKAISTNDEPLEGGEE
jgi:hypothetical protein